MLTESPLRKSDSYRFTALALGLVAAVIGCVVLTGWLLDIAAPKSVLPGLATMKPNTAVGILLCGVALALASRTTLAPWGRILGTSLAIVAIVLGALTLGEYLFGWNARIDEGLVRDLSLASQTSHPGRMSPSTAFCFLVAGSALAVSYQSISPLLRLPILTALAAANVVIGITALTGYATDALFQARWWNYSGMAVHTAAAFVLLGWGLLVLVKCEGGLKCSLDPLTVGGFVVGIGSLLVCAGVSYHVTDQLRDDAAWVSHSQEVLKEIQKTDSGVANLLTETRDYTITGDDRTLEPREQEQTAMREDLRTLRGLTSDNIHQQLRLDALGPLIDQRIAWEEATIAARREQGFSAAARMIATDNGAHISAGAQRLLGEMDDEERALLDVRRTKSAASAATTFLFLPLGVFLSMTILSLGLFFLNIGVQERTRAERSLVQLASIVEFSDDAIISKDLNGVVTSWNAGAEDIFGYCASEMVGHSILRLIPPGRQDEEEQILERIRHGYNIKHHETVRLRKDDRLIDVSLTISPIKDARGKIVGASKIARDITKSKLAEELLRAKDEEMRAMSQQLGQAAKLATMGELSASIAHELNNPLFTITLRIESLLGQLPADDPKRRPAEIVHQEVKRMANLVAQLLQFSRRGQSETSSLDIRDEIEKTLELISFHLRQRNIAVLCEFSPEIPTVQADRQKIRQVLINLFNNGADAMPLGGSLCIRVYRDNDMVVTDVGDTGTGISEENLAKLREPFFTTKPAGKGTGLGLAICRRIVAEHNGKFEIFNNPDKGATARMALPATNAGSQRN